MLSRTRTQAMGWAAPEGDFAPIRPSAALLSSR